MATIGELAVNVTANTGGLERGLMRARGATRTFASSIGTGLGSLARFTAGVGAAAAGLAAVGAAAARMGVGVRLAAEQEQASVAFTTMIGDAQRAKKLLEETKAFSAATPFNQAEIVDAARKLLAFNTEAENVVPTLTRIGDVSAGIGAPIGEIAEIYGKAQVQGRLFMEDINQLTGRGIPIIQELAKQFGVNESQVRSLVEQGRVGFPQLEAAFKSLTSEGGKFAGLMEAQSRTLTGLFSTITDNVGQLAAELAKVGMEGLGVKSLLEAAGQLVAHFGQAVENVGPELQQSFAALGLAVRELVGELFGVEEPVELFESALQGVAWAINKIAQTVELVKINLLFAKAAALTIADVFSAGSLHKESAAARQAALDAVLRQDVTTRTQGVLAAAQSATAGGGGGGPVRSTLTDQDAALDEFRAWTKKQAESPVSEFEPPMARFERKWYDLRVLLDAGAISQGLYNRALARYREELRQSDPLWQKMSKLFEETRTPLERYRAEVAELNALFANGLDPEVFRRSLANAERRFRESDPRAKRQQELRERAKELNAENPLAKFRANVAELFALGRTGLLTPEAFARRREEIFDQARGDLGQPPERQHAGALLAGGQEAFSALVRAQGQNDQLAETKRQTQFLAQIERQMVQFLASQPTPVTL